MNYARERAHELWGEIMPLLRRHWEEIAHYQDIPLNPDVHKYCALEDGDMLRCYTARLDDGELVGYAVFVLAPNMHYGVVMAVQDVIYLAPEYRAAGDGRRLIRYCDEQLKAEVAKAVYHHVKLGFDFSPLLLQEGYELIEYVLGKRL